MRTLVRNLRVGANWRSVLSALGRASVVYEACHAPVTTDAPDVSSTTAASAPPSTRRAALSKEALDAGATAAVDAFHRCPSLGRIVAALRAGGVGSLEATCGVATGIPLHPMLAKITEGFEDCVKQLTGQAALAEFKYDGQRAQIHVSESGEVRTLALSRVFVQLVGAVNTCPLVACASIVMCMLRRASLLGGETMHQ